MPALLGFTKGVQDGFAGRSEVVPVLEPLDVHAGIDPSERSPDLEHRNELRWRRLSKFVRYPKYRGALAVHDHGAEWSVCPENLARERRQ